MAVFVVVIGWLTIALALTLAMARRGHDVFMWAILSTVLGPLALPLAVRATSRGAGRTTTPRRPGAVLVGVDRGADPVELAHCLAEVPSLDRATGITLAAVLDLETPDTAAGRADIRATEEHLLDVAAALAADGRVSPPFERVVTFGEPAEELARLANDGGFAMVVLGGPASSAEHLLRGSVRARLAERTRVPLVLTGVPAR